MVGGKKAAKGKTGGRTSYMSYDTLPFDDYSKYVAPRFDPIAKAERRRTVFPEDCRKAFDMGARLANPTI